MLEDRIEHRVSLDLVRYANCWEDADVLCEALQPAKRRRVLSIASAGDNALALLAEGAEVVAVDLSLAQLACVEIKREAFRRLDHDGVLRFLGVRPSKDRLVVFDRLKAGLSDFARRFWEGHRSDVVRGVIHAGKFEAFFRLFRRRVLPFIHSSRTIRLLLEPKDRKARIRFYENRWNNLRWQILFRVFFGRFMMGRIGRDPEFFRYVEGSVADRILSRARYALTELPTHANPYLDYILSENFRSLPRYLRPEHFEAIRSGLDRLTLVHGSIDQVDGQFDALNLSDIFEYLAPATCLEIYRRLLDLARPGARIAYWNTLVPRRCPPELADRVRPLRDLERRLYAHDFAFFYCDFVLEESTG